MKNRSGCGLSPAENITHCLAHKPPLVLFTVGLCILAIAFVFLAYYVRDTETITDPNYRTDWGSFLTGLSDISWSSDSSCVKDAQKLPTGRGNLTHQVFVTVYASVSTGYTLDAATIYQAAVWKEKLLPKELLKKRDESVIVSFSHMNKNHTDSGSLDVSGLVPLCMNISCGVPFLSPNLNLPTQCTPMSPATSAVKQMYGCDKSTTSLNFHTVYEGISEQGDSSLRMYLGYNDRMNIHIHVMYTSYFLFTIAATVLLYGFLKRKGHVTSQDPMNASLLSAAAGSEV